MTPSFSALIVDDDYWARQKLRRLVESNYSNVLVAEASYAAEGLVYVARHKPDLVFLDMEMPHGSGLQFLQATPERSFEVVFVSAHHISMFDDGISDDVYFVPKPINRVLFAVTMDKVFAKIRQKCHQNLLDKNTEICPHSIIRAEANGSYCVVYTTDGKSTTLVKCLSKLQADLPASVFFRAHRSHLVNINHVSKYRAKRDGFLQMSCGTQVPLSQQKAAAFKTFVEGLATKGGGLQTDLP